MQRYGLVLTFTNAKFNFYTSGNQEINMFEEHKKERWIKHLVFYVFVASITIIVMSAFTISFRARLAETEKCGYDACSGVVVNTDANKAQLLSCRCQCESTQILTDECSSIYECVRSEACWRLNKK